MMFIQSHGAGSRRVLRAFPAAVAMLVLASVSPSLGAMTGTTNKPMTLDEAYFKIVKDNNIFNPKRYVGYAPPKPGPGSQRPQADYFALVGIMNYDKGPFAFFEGNRSE